MSQSSVSETRTVITSSSSNYGGGSVADTDPSIYYKSQIHPRSNVISRTPPSNLRNSTGGSTIIRSVEYGYGHGPHIGQSSGQMASGVENVKHNREREKKDLRELNERFANYIEKVRFLEAQNRKLAGELDGLRSKWGKESMAIKQMYETELGEARKLIDDLSKEKTALEIKVSSITDQLADLSKQLDDHKKYRQLDREQITKLNQQLAEYESEISVLRRSVDGLETDRTRDRSRIHDLQKEVDKLRIDLNNETLNHLDAENRLQTLQEEVEFMKKIHEQELKELSALAYRDTTAENREFWKSELSQAIRDIQNEYDAKVDQMRGEMEGYYNLKVQEFRTGATKQNMEVTHVREENKKVIKEMSGLRGKLADLEARNAHLERQYQELMRELESKDQEHTLEVSQLREEITKMRADTESILAELQTLMDAKLSLELEIAAYRKLLEGEETRVEVCHTLDGVTVIREALRSMPQMSSDDDAAIKKIENDIIADSLKQHVEVEATHSEHVSASSTTMSSAAAASEYLSVVETKAESSSSDTKSDSSLTESKMDSSASSVTESTIIESGTATAEEVKEKKKNNEDESISTSEKSVENDTRDVVGQTTTSGPDSEESQMSMKMMRGEVSAKTTYQRTSTGPIAIAEVNPEGKFITMENTSSGPTRKDVNLDGFKLKRSIDGKREHVYNFRNFTLKPGKGVKVFARGSASEAGINDLIFRDDETWGVGSQVTTTLINDKGEEKASHIQKTLYN